MALALIVPAAGLIVPGLDRLWLSRGVAAMIARHEPPAGTPLTVVGYTEPSLVFLLNNDFKAQTADVPVPAGGEALVSSRDVAAFQRELAKGGVTARLIDEVCGIDYSNGQEMTLSLYRIEPQ